MSQQLQATEQEVKESPEYLRMSLSSAMALRFRSGLFHRNAKSPCVNLLMTYDEMVSRYGEDNAKFLWDQLGNLRQHYSKITYIEMGIEPDDRFERRAREDAAENDWEFEKVEGDMDLIRQLVDGPWDEDKFLVVEPGQRIAPQYNELIVQIEQGQ